VLASLEGLLPELQAGRLPEPTYPRFWRVAVNETVARSLNIVVSDEVRHLGNKPAARSR